MSSPQLTPDRKYMEQPLNRFGNNEAPDDGVGVIGCFESYGMNLVALEGFLDSHPELMSSEGEIQDFYYE